MPLVSLCLILVSGNACLTKWEVPLLFHFLEEFVSNGQYFFHKYFENFTFEGSYVGRFLMIILSQCTVAGLLGLVSLFEVSHGSLSNSQEFVHSAPCLQLLDMELSAKLLCYFSNYP